MDETNEIKQESGSPAAPQTETRRPPIQKDDYARKLPGHRVMLIFIDGKAMECKILGVRNFELLVQPNIAGSLPTIIYKHSLKSIAPKDESPWNTKPREEKPTQRIIENPDEARQTDEKGGAQDAGRE